MPCYAIDGVRPVVHPDAFVHPTAVLIGDVVVGPDCYVGPGASIRGDFGRLILEAGSNLQDNCVMHGFPATDTLVERDGHIGHGAVLHGCHLEPNVMVGMNAVVMDEARVGESAMIGACAFVPTRSKIDARCLYTGVPARRVRELGEEEIAWKSQGTAIYQELARRSARSMVEVMPLPEQEAERRRFTNDDVLPPSHHDEQD